MTDINLEELDDPAQESTEEELLDKLEEATESLQEEEMPLESQSFSTDQVLAIRKFLDRFGLETSELSNEEVTRKYIKIKQARDSAVQVLSRGQVSDTARRLLGKLPSGYVGEFIRENPQDVDRAKALGWELFHSPEAKVESSTGKSDGYVRCGDTILVYMPEEVYVGNQIARHERIQDRRGRRKAAIEGKVPFDQGGGEVSADPLFPVKVMK